MNALGTWSLDREIVLCRIFDAPRERLFEAWAGAHHLARWFGPEGFEIETEEANVSPGGQWRFAFVAPDGSRYGNRVAFIDVAPPERIVFEHGPDLDDAPERFRVTVTFDAQDDGKTVLTMRQLHPTREQRDGAIAFGAVELGYQTLDKLARYVGGA